MRAGYKRFKALNVLEKCASREFSVFTVFLFCFFFYLQNSRRICFVFVLLFFSFSKESLVAVIKKSKVVLHIIKVQKGV